MVKRKLLSGKTIEIQPMPTHIAYTANKRVPNKYMKITNQSIYNGDLATYARAIVVKNLHDFIIGCIPDNFGFLKMVVKPVFTFYVVKNYGGIRRRKKDGYIMWKPVTDLYKANWDDDNLAFLWIKTIKDALSKAKVWQDDSVEYCRGGNWDVVFVDDIQDMKIVINFIALT